MAIAFPTNLGMHLFSLSTEFSLQIKNTNFITTFVAIP